MVMIVLKIQYLSFWFWWGIGYVPSLDDAIQGVKVHDIFEKYISIKLFYKRNLIWRLILMKT
jgi:hypothetical protein